LNDRNGRHARLRYTATGAIAALAAVGVIAGTGALAANPRANAHGHAAMANNSTKAPQPANGSTKTPAPGKDRTPQPPEAYDPRNPFLIAIQQLVDDGTITVTEGQAVDREILSGYTNTERLASTGLTQTQIQAVERALENTKLAQAPPPLNAKGPRS
jgi:hypothetical protein